MTKLSEADRHLRLAPTCKHVADRFSRLEDALRCVIESLASPPPSDTVDGAGERDIAYELTQNLRALDGSYGTLVTFPFEAVHKELATWMRRAEAAEAQRDALIDANGGADGYESALRWPMLQREKIARLESDRDAARARVAEVTRSRFLAQQAAVELLGAIEGADIAVEPGPRARRLQEAADKVRLFERPPGKPCPSRWCSKPLGHDDECDFALEEPTPSAPTPAVVEKRFVSGAHVYRHYGIIPGIEALAASLPTDPDDEAVVDAMMAKRKVGERVMRDGGGETTGNEPPESVDVCAIHLTVAYRGECIACRGDRHLYRYDLAKKGPNEQRNSEEEAAEASAKVVATPGSGDVGESVRCDAPGAVEPGGLGGPGGVAPRGLTPAEAEAHVRDWYERHRPPQFVGWGALERDECEHYVAFYRFAHSEGSRAGQAKGAEFFREHAREIVSTLQREAYDLERRHNGFDNRGRVAWLRKAASELESLARESGGESD